MAPPSAGGRWFRRLLRLLPFEIRRDYGADMEQAFADERADTRAGVRSAARLWAATAWGLLHFARREHWNATQLDLRHAWRGWRRAPLLFGTLILTMAAGIAALTTAFSVVDAVVLKPLPVPHATSIVRVVEHHGDARSLGNLTYATFLDVRARSRTLRDVAASRLWFANLTGEGEPERLPGAFVSGDFFAALGSVPAAGRLLDERDDRPGHDRVLVISHELWVRRFGGSPDAIGRTVRVNDLSYEIVGVVPEGEAWPLGTDAWAPLVARDGRLATNRQSHLLQVFGRLSPGRSTTEAGAELSAIAAAIAASDPGADPDLALAPAPLLATIVGPVRSTLVAVLAGAALLLVVLFTNVAHVLLARAAARERELAVLTALGAGRLRVARLLLTESVALFLLAGVAGALGAWLLIGWLPTMLPAELPRLDTVRLDWRALAVSLGTAAAAGVGFGAWPAIRAARLERATVSTLRSAGVGGRAQRSWLVPGGPLASIQLALAFALTVAAVLLVHSAIEVGRIPLGFVPDRLLKVDLSLSPHRLPHEADGDAYVGVLGPIVSGIAALPGVTAAGFTTVPPFGGGPATSFRLEGRPVTGDEPVADVRMVDAGYFEAMGIPLRGGRGFAASDGSHAESVIVVSERLAREWFPGEDAIGRSMTRLDWGPPLTARIVGIVGDVPGQELERDPPPTVYFHYPQFPQLFGLSLFVRTREDPAALASSVREVIRRLEPNQPLTRIEPMTARLAEVRSRRLVLTTILGGFAVASVVFALIGLYGVLTDRTTRQGPAFGLRLALGATPADLVRLVLVEALSITIVGLALGGPAALAAGRLLDSLLFETTALDPVALTASGAMVAAVAVLAALIPARRAARVDPASALRAE